MELRPNWSKLADEIRNHRGFQLALPVDKNVEPLQKCALRGRIIQDQEDYLLLKEVVEKLTGDLQDDHCLSFDLERERLEEARKLISNFDLLEGDVKTLRPYGSKQETSKLMLGGREFACTRLVPTSLMHELRELRKESVKVAVRSCVNMMVARFSQEVSKDPLVRKRQQIYNSEMPDTSKYRNLPMNQKKLFLCRSLIHEWGLFTLQDIPSNDLIIEYVGEKIRSCVADERERKRGLDASSYFFRINFEYVIDAMNFGNISKYINHSCDPNCYARVVDIDGEPKILIFASKPIPAGSELTYDYQFPYEDTKIPCKCGSEKCRGFLN